MWYSMTFWWYWLSSLCVINWTIRMISKINHSCNYQQKSIAAIFASVSSAPIQNWTWIFLQLIPITTKKRRDLCIEDLKWILTWSLAHSKEDQQSTILLLCCSFGCLALLLLVHFPTPSFLFSDVMVHDTVPLTQNYY